MLGSSSAAGIIKPESSTFRTARDLAGYGLSTSFTRNRSNGIIKTWQKRRKNQDVQFQNATRYFFQKICMSRFAITANKRWKKTMAKKKEENIKNDTRPIRISKRGGINEGRPSKKTEKFLRIAEEVISHDINAIISTDEELVFAINEKLEEKERITQRTFENWKAEETRDELGKKFFRLIKKALYRQKTDLFNQFRKEPNQWQRWAWIIERKFDDWNIRYKVDGTIKVEPIRKVSINIAKE